MPTRRLSPPPIRQSDVADPAAVAAAALFPYKSAAPADTLGGTGAEPPTAARTRRPSVFAITSKDHDHERCQADSGRGARPGRQGGRPGRSSPGPGTRRDLRGGSRRRPIALDFNQTRQLIFAGHFLTTSSRSTSTARRRRAIPRDYQLDPVKDLPIHVDFLRLADGQTIKVEVPVHVVGQEPVARRQARRHRPDRRALASSSLVAVRRDPGVHRGLGRRPRHRRLGPSRATSSCRDGAKLTIGTRPHPRHHRAAVGHAGRRGRAGGRAAKAAAADAGRRPRHAKPDAPAPARRERSGREAGAFRYRGPRSAHAPLRRPRQSGRALCRQPAQCRLHGRRRDRARPRAPRPGAGASRARPPKRSIGGEKVLLLKPQTYMNEFGPLGRRGRSASSRSRSADVVGLPRRARPAAGQAAGEGRRRQCRP